VSAERARIFYAAEYERVKNTYLRLRANVTIL